MFNASLLFSDSGVYIGDSNNVALHDVGLWQVNFGIHMESVVKLKINNVFATGSIFGVFSAYNSRSLTIRHLTAVNWTGYSFYFQNTTDASLQNLTIKSGTVKTSQVENSEGLIISSKVTIENTVFSDSISSLVTIDITQQPAVLQIINSQVDTANCSFENNNITPLKLRQSFLTVSGNLNFTNNTAFRGGAMIFIHNNTFFLSENSTATFVGNRAVDTGGAIYIVTSTYEVNVASRFSLSGYIVCTNCFLGLDDYINYENQLIFSNNSAGQGGDVLYGGRLGHTCHFFSCLNQFFEISVINPKTLSPISSDPSRVCYCNKSGIPDCWTLYHPTVFSVYPGQKISISAVVVGQNFGTVAGSVFAQFLNSKPIPQLDVRESAQEVQHIHCNQLTYTIFSPGEDYHTVLVLTAVKISINEFFTKEFDKLEDESTNGILDTPVYAEVNLMPCPPGFLLIVISCVLYQMWHATSSTQHYNAEG